MVGDQPGLQRSGGLNSELILSQQPFGTAIPAFAIPARIHRYRVGKGGGDGIEFVAVTLIFSGLGTARNSMPNESGNEIAVTITVIIRVSETASPPRFWPRCDPTGLGLSRV